jgi:hypothetical protein
VGAAAGGFPRTLDHSSVNHLGGVPGEHYVRTVLSPFYSPEIFGDSPHSWFGPRPAAAAGMVAVLSRAADPPDPGPLPADLLLLPRRLLQGVLGGSAFLHGRRAEVIMLGREFVSPSR